MQRTGIPVLCQLTTPSWQNTCTVAYTQKTLQTNRRRPECIWNNGNILLQCMKWSKRQTTRVLSTSAKKIHPSGTLKDNSIHGHHWDVLYNTKIQLSTVYILQTKIKTFYSASKNNSRCCLLLDYSCKITV